MSKAALIALVRAYRMSLVNEGITINAVAPAATLTPLLPEGLVRPLLDAGLPVSTPEHVAKALIFSATAKQSTSVSLYGKEADQPRSAQTPWNGRVIYTTGDTYTEVEENLEDTKPGWLGATNVDLLQRQQRLTDARGMN
ncbi:MAG: hypothetical protein Q9159_006306 [Coniocarpon cinnabarinum]